MKLLLLLRTAQQTPFSLRFRCCGQDRRHLCGSKRSLLPSSLLCVAASVVVVVVAVDPLSSSFYVPSLLRLGHGLAALDLTPHQHVALKKRLNARVLLQVLYYFQSRRNGYYIVAMKLITYLTESHKDNDAENPK